MYKKITALCLTAVLAVAGCTSTAGTSGGGSSQPHSAPSMECMPNINCPASGASAPAGGGHSSPKASKQPLPQDTYAFRWGDYKFGSCTLALFPGYMGLTVSNAHVVVLGGTGCVGFRPQSVSITMTLERWYSVGGAPRAWHDAGLVILYNSDIDGLPPLVIPAPDGSVPLSELHQLKDAIPCVRDIAQGLSLYRLNVKITGISYSGKPFGSGGEGATLAVHNSECNH